MAQIKTEAVGPYIALIAYARAAGARGHDQAKAVVDDTLADHPDAALPELCPVIDARLGGLASGIIRP